MEQVSLTPERAAQLETVARLRGKDPAELADEALAAYLEREEALAREEQEIRQEIDRRYDDAVNGRAELLDPDDVRRELAKRHAAYLAGR